MYKRQAWYNRELSAAVSLGIFNGVSATQMAPMRSITRQEAFTVLARAFGLYPRDRQAYTRFRDCERVQPYARDAGSALADVYKRQTWRLCCQTARKGEERRRSCTGNP